MTTEERYDWVNNLRSQFLKSDHIGTTWDKCLRKFSENSFPAIAGGAIATVAAFSFGMYKCITGKELMSQRMMRFKALAQGFTVTSLVVKVMMSERNLKDSPPINVMARAMRA